MLKNYLKIALRNIIKHKIYSGINILGLAIGISASLVIVLFARYELTFDQFHTKSEDIYLVYKERVTPTGLQATYDTWVPLLSQMKTDFPEVVNGTRVFIDNGVPLSVDEKSFSEDIYYVDKGYFEIFDFPLENGNNENPFSNLNSAIISRKMSTKLFGIENAIGKRFTLDHQTSYIVSGIQDEYPSNAFIGNEIIVQIESNPTYSESALDWGSSFLLTYILLEPNSSAESLIVKFPDFITSVFDDEVQKRTNFNLLPLHDSYNTFIGDSSDSLILLYIAFGIILIASINFMNLSTARSLERAREIGMRKVLGAQKKQLIFQFLSEAMFMTIVALLIAIVLAELVLPILNVLYSMELKLDYTGNYYTLPILILFGIGLGALSGSYPAFYLSNFKILESMKGVLTNKIGGFSLKNLLVVVQFALSIILIIGTLIITSQLGFMKNTDLAFNKDNLIVIPVSSGEFEDAAEAQGKLETFKNEIANHHSISTISTSRHVPGRWSDSNTFVRPEGFEGNPLRMRYTFMDANFFNTYEVDLIEGTGFLPDTEGDQRESVIINEAALKAFGWSEISDKVIHLGSSGERPVKVVGLIKDFNYETMRNQVQPILHFHRVPSNGTHRYITARTSTENHAETLKFIESKWQILNSERDFSYFFVEEDLKLMYTNEDRLLQMVTVFSALSIFVSCLGLYGLSAFIIERRKKEIGIRKVLGASNSNISFMISKGFTGLVLIAFVIASPVAYFLLERWLQDFAYQISIPVWIFGFSMVLSVIIAWLTVSIKSFQAAIENPVNSIKES